MAGRLGKFVGALYRFGGQYYLYCRKCAQRSRWNTKTIPREGVQDSTSGIWIIYSSQMTGIHYTCCGWHCRNVVGDPNSIFDFEPASITRVYPTPEEICTHPNPASLIRSLELFSNISIPIRRIAETLDDPADVRPAST